jgi:septum formation protein
VADDARAEPDGVRLVLASASPRRRILLDGLDLDFEVRTADLDEAPRPGEQATALALRLAGEKAAAVARAGEVAIAADTVVALDGVLLGKPADPDEARRMLELLSDRTHEVTTGVAVRAVTGDGVRQGTVAVVTEVRFAPLRADDIDWYVATGEPMDKAGAYGLQGVGGHLIRSVAGSPTNVIGLPLAETIELAESVGVDLRQFRRSRSGRDRGPFGGPTDVP